MESGGENPTWPIEGGTVELPYDGVSELLHIRIFDADVGKDDDLVGEACLNTTSLLALGEFSGEVQVYRRGTKPRGRLSVEARWRFEAEGPALQPVKDAERLVEATPAKAHRNFAMGCLHSMGEGGAYSGFVTYEVGLQRTAEVFGDFWNAGADGIHPDTFAEDARGCLVRSALSAAHRNLYRDDNTWQAMHGRTSTMFLGSGADFLEMIEYGVRDDRRRVYTYSIVDAGFFFSETGAALTKDSASKHIIHADAAMRVRYAGTFRVCQRRSSPGVVAPPAHVLVIDNDSGTYVPKPEHQPALTRLLQLNFPGLDVLTMSVLEPQPEWSRELVGPNEQKGDCDAVYCGTWSWALA